MIGNGLRPADRAEEDRAVPADPHLPVVRQHLAVALVIVARGKVEMIELQRDAEAPRRGVERAQSFGNDFPPDAVPRDHGDAQGRRWRICVQWVLLVDGRKISAAPAPADCA
ncbi:hypothetical protein GALL_518660 [mine drainage metagenome]|uniref:Uncharacterized protein n=1 Tax=mine drainage metagenome TaxID=410659 RepID=A0A1J5P5U0_9ZZZZ